MTKGRVFVGHFWIFTFVSAFLNTWFRIPKYSITWNKQAHINHHLCSFNFSPYYEFISHFSGFLGIQFHKLGLRKCKKWQNRTDWFIPVKSMRLLVIGDEILSTTDLHCIKFITKGERERSNMNSPEPWTEEKMVSSDIRSDQKENIEWELLSRTWFKNILIDLL